MNDINDLLVCLIYLVRDDDCVQLCAISYGQFVHNMLMCERYKRSMGVSILYLVRDDDFVQLCAILWIICPSYVDV